MRIVAGEWRGRRLATPHGRSTRPTSDRVREAVFDALCARLGPDFGGLAVLDAFAGTGALGLEALSRGADRAVFVERDPLARRSLAANVEALGAGDSSTIVVGDAFSLAERDGLPEAPFALLLLDPPYRIEPAQVGGLLQTLAGSGALTDGALVVYEHDGRAEPVWPEGFSQVWDRGYGSTRVGISIYRREGSSPS